MNTSKQKPDAASERAKPATVQQVSAGGVAFRRNGTSVEVALISVGKEIRWQLPKGIVDPGETPEITAIREVREEAGIDTEVLEKLDTIEYWYVGNQGAQRVRFHKFVHFFLTVYRAGDISKHDWEVNEARWVPLAEAKSMLAFKSERQVLEKAAERIAILGR